MTEKSCRASVAKDSVYSMARYLLALNRPPFLTACIFRDTA